MGSIVCAAASGLGEEGARGSCRFPAQRWRVQACASHHSSPAVTHRHSAAYLPSTTALIRFHVPLPPPSRHQVGIALASGLLSQSHAIGPPACWSGCLCAWVLFGGLGVLGGGARRRERMVLAAGSHQLRDSYVSSHRRLSLSAVAPAFGPTPGPTPGPTSGPTSDPHHEARARASTLGRSSFSVSSPLSGIWDPTPAAPPGCSVS